MTIKVFAHRILYSVFERCAVTRLNVHFTFCLCTSNAIIIINSIKRTENGDNVRFESSIKYCFVSFPFTQDLIVGEHPANLRLENKLNLRYRHLPFDVKIKFFNCHLSDVTMIDSFDAIAFLNCWYRKLHAYWRAGFSNKHDAGVLVCRLDSKS